MSKNKTKGKFTMPDTYVIIVLLIIFAVILTYIIPTGRYDVAEDGKTVIANSYHSVERNPAGIGDFLSSFYNGLIKGTSTVLLVLVIGGAFGVLNATGSIDAALGAAIKKTQGNHKLILPVVIVVMSLLGSIGAGGNVSIAFLPILIILCDKLKLDKVVAVGCMYFASNSGFASSPWNPFSVLLAQDIAGVTYMSGLVPRLIMWFIITGLAIWWVMRYANKIKNDPSKSLCGVYGGDATNADAESAISDVVAFSGRHIACICALVVAFGIFIYGAIALGWGLNQLAACMMGMAFVVAFIGRLGASNTATQFVEGAKTMVYSGLLIGFACSISVILENANIIHSIIYYLCLPLTYMPKAIVAIGMELANFIINFFIPSGSGQAYVTMPIFGPMADVLGITRQVAISAFQFGDGFCNLVIPTDGLLMGSLGMVGLGDNKWLRFSVPIIALYTLCGAVFLIITTSVGWM